jgi:hypothetical protein
LHHLEGSTQRQHHHHLGVEWHHQQWAEQKRSVESRLPYVKPQIKDQSSRATRELGVILT